MAVAAVAGLPVALSTFSASPHEVTLVEPTLDAVLVDDAPQRLIGDKAYDSDPLDQRLLKERQIDLIAPHRRNRKKPKTQDGRKLRRYKRRWKIERFFAWLQNYRITQTYALTCYHDRTATLQRADNIMNYGLTQPLRVQGIRRGRRRS